MDVKENLPTILSIASCAGVVGTGLAAVELGKELEKRKHELREKKRLIIKAGITIGSGAFTIGGILLSNKLNKDKLELTKKELAEVTAALGTVTKIFHDYRSREEPERDKEIMNDIALKGCYDSPEHASEYEYDYNGNMLQLWTDPYINALSDGKYSYYKASEADVLAASNYMINTFCDKGIVTLSEFYESLRLRGVDIPTFKGEKGIIWEGTNERWDYYGRYGLDFNYTTESIQNGTPINIIYFDDDDDMINSSNSELQNWTESLARE